MIKINPSWIVDWEKKKIQKDFNINDIEKKINFVKKNYPSKIISVNLIELYFLLTHHDYKNHYRDIKNLFLLFLGYLKLIPGNLFKQKKYNSSNLLIFSNHKFVDQLNFSETSNFLLKKKKEHLVVLNHTADNFEKIKSLYKTKNIINLRNFLSFSDILKIIKLFFLSLRSINHTITVLNCKKIRFQVYELFLNFFIQSELWNKVLKKNKVEKLFLSFFSRNNALIYRNELQKKNIKFIGYAVTGLDGDTPRYIFHSLDKLLVLGKVDIKIIKKIKKYKLKFMGLPKKTLIVGSARHDFFLKKRIIKKKKKKFFHILYIKSNPHYLDGLEDKAFMLFSKLMNNQKGIKYAIKDRENRTSRSTRMLIDKKIIKAKFLDKSGFIEQSINKADLCVGTNSTALLRQAINMNKPIIQLCAKKHYMWNSSKKIISACNEKQIVFCINKLVNDRKYYYKYLNSHKKLKKYILSNELKANKKIYEILK